MGDNMNNVSRTFNEFFPGISKHHVFFATNNFFSVNFFLNSLIMNDN